MTLPLSRLAFACIVLNKYDKVEYGAPAGVIEAVMGDIQKATIEDEKTIIAFPNREIALEDFLQSYNNKFGERYCVVRLK